MRIQQLLPLALLGVAAGGCTAAMKYTPSDADRVLAHQTLEAPDPSRPGPYDVLHLYYGSGTDKNRPEYRDSVAFKTPSVDASKLVDLGKNAKSRNRYWGFKPDSFPLNARVWYPDGAGPFPLVLIVHGNHNMKDYSDPGYAYLGEVLASRGYIAASLDENFLNGSIRGENDARAWVLLKHLEAWKGFNADPSNPFHGKVDMDRIAIIGHSRGGEAVGHAAAFNQLEYYPDDASVKFDFHFHIRSVVAIAPVDGQYKPTDRLVPIHDVNYLVFEGSHDGDVSSFVGLRTWDRVRFTDTVPRFKAAVYVYRANHGQWNTVWGAHDSGPRSARILDLRNLLPGDQQREFAKIYISAFLDATLKDDTRYLPMFRDHRVIGHWLPKTMYITRFETSAFRPVATFQEDVDIAHGTVPGVTLQGDSLSTWKEEMLPLRWQNTMQENNAVWLGWNNKYAGEDSATAPPASYTVTLPDTLAAAWHLARDGEALRFLLAPTDVVPKPHKKEEEGAAKETKAAGKGVTEKAQPGAKQSARNEHEHETAPKPPLDLSVELVDAAGHVARLPLSRYGAIRRPLEMNVLRRPGWDKRRFRTMYELVLQSYALPLSDFVAENPALDPGTLRQVRFVFDRSDAGTVVVDEIGFARLAPAWWSARLQDDDAAAPVAGGGR